MTSFRFIQCFPDSAFPLGNTAQRLCDRCVVKFFARRSLCSIALSISHFSTDCNCIRRFFENSAESKKLFLLSNCRNSLCFTNPYHVIFTKKSVAIPGTSEHATGLAVDIMSTKYGELDEKQGDTEEQKWLMEHCSEYGFVLRFPQDKSDITGIVYEPWHYRYVGVDAAKEMTENGLTLEEYDSAN